MMTKEELIQIPQTAKRIQHERDKIETMKSKLYSPRGLDTNEKVQHSGTTDPILADVVIDAEAELQSQVDALEAQEARAREFIEGALSGEDRQLMMLRYVDALEWEEVARLMIYAPQTIFRRSRLIMDRLFKEDADE